MKTFPVNFTPEELKSEEWRPVSPPYQISSLGRLRKSFHASEFNLPANLDGNGWHHTYLKPRRQYLVYHHQGSVAGSTRHIVYEAFIGPIPPDHRITHKDGDRDNCRVSNLQATLPSASTVARKKYRPRLSWHLDLAKDFKKRAY